jgi:hypothetical protein
MLLLSLVSFGAIVLAWVVAPEGRTTQVTKPVATPAQAIPARA